MKWTLHPDGSQVAQIQLTSQGAQAIRLGIKVDRLDDGVEMRFWGSENNLQAVGPITWSDIRTQDGIYWTPTTFGENVALEIRLPVGADPNGIKGEIVQLSHLVANPAVASRKSFLFTPSPQPESSCQRNVVCSNDAKMQQQAHAVAQMLFMDSGSAYVCTGTLLNNARQDRTPFLYTAAHCIQNQRVANTLNTWWFYEAASCGGTATLLLDPNLPNGAQLLYSDTSRDATLLMLYDQAPNGVTFSGWDAAPLQIGDEVVGLHHPGANPTKYATGTVRDNFHSFNGNNGLSYSNFLEVVWNAGLTEEGSSGSGLFTAGTYILKGSLFGGPSETQACSGGRSSYSPFSGVYPAISQYINSSAPQALIAGSASGIVTGTTIGFQLTPIPSDIGQQVNLYIGINYSDGSWKLFDSARSSWVPLGSGPFPVFKTLTMTSQIGWDLFENIDTTQLPHGMAYYVGYGVNDADLLSGKYGVIYKVP